MTIRGPMSVMIQIPEETQIFIVEASENLDKMEQDLVLLEEDPLNSELVSRIFRSVHTIKGNSGFLGFPKMEKLCHCGESLLDLIRSGRVVLSGEIITALLQFADLLRQDLGAIQKIGIEPDSDHSALLSRIAEFGAR